jgi:hypothetical protein
VSTAASAVLAACQETPPVPKGDWENGINPTTLPPIDMTPVLNTEELINRLENNLPESKRYKDQLTQPIIDSLKRIVDSMANLSWDKDLVATVWREMQNNSIEFSPYDQMRAFYGENGDNIQLVAMDPYIPGGFGLVPDMEVGANATSLSVVLNLNYTFGSQFEMVMFLWQMQLNARVLTVAAAADFQQFIDDEQKVGLPLANATALFNPSTETPYIMTQAWVSWEMLALLETFLESSGEEQSPLAGLLLEDYKDDFQEWRDIQNDSSSVEHGWNGAWLNYLKVKLSDKPQAGILSEYARLEGRYHALPVAGRIAEV